jgi:glycosyltransferase involved in cell wall biosynthesis
MSAPKIPILLMARELDIGGSERQMTEVAKRLDPSVFAPHVGCFRPAGLRGDELRDSGVTVIQFPLYSYRSPAAFREASHLVRYIRDQGIRIVHTWDYPLTVYAIPITRMITKAITVSSQRCHRGLIPSGYRALVGLSDHMAHAVVVNCDYLRVHLTEERVPEHKIRVCYNGIDLDRFRRLPRAARGLTIGVVCALRPEKDLGTLIDAFALVRDLQSDLKLVIVGSGDQLPGLQRRAREAGIEQQCHFEPATPTVAEWLSMIDIFVLPSRSEAFSNSLMEAMACGCCAIASDIGGNPELVRDRETGILFRQGDARSLAEALRALIADPGLRARLAASGERSIRSRFSAEEAADRMGEIYLKLLQDQAERGFSRGV